MWEFAKSSTSFFLAQSLFVLKEAQNIVAPRERGERKGPATRALDAVTAATLEQLGDGLNAAFRVIDTGQRFALALAFNMLLPYISNFGSASSREAAWERQGECSRPPAYESPGDAAKASMEQEARSMWEDLTFRAD
jgi:hypothetical protein